MSTSPFRLRVSHRHTGDIDFKSHLQHRISFNSLLCSSFDHVKHRQLSQIEPFQNSTSVSGFDFGRRCEESILRIKWPLKLKIFSEARLSFNLRLRPCWLGGEKRQLSFNFSLQPSLLGSWLNCMKREAQFLTSDFSFWFRREMQYQFLTSDFRVQCSRPRERVCKRVNFKVQHLSFNFRTEVVFTRARSENGANTG